MGTASAYPLIIAILLVCWAGLGICLAASWRTLRRTAFPTGDGSWPVIALAGATVLALGLRLWLSPRLPMLSTYAGLEHISTAYSIARLEWAGPFQTTYPLAIPSLAAALMSVFGQTPEVFQFTVLALSTALTPALYLVGRLLWNRPHEGLVAALLAAVYPPLLTFSASGSLAIPYATLAALGLALGLVWMRTNGTTALLGALCALLLALQTRLEAALIVLPAAAVVGREWWMRSSQGRSGFPLARKDLYTIGSFVLLALPYVLSKAGELTGSEYRGHAAGWSGTAHLLLRILVVLGIMTAWGIHHQRKARGTLIWPFVVLALGWYLFVEQAVGGEIFHSGPMAFEDGSFAATYAPLGLLYLDPMLTPLALILAYFASFTILADRNERSIWLMLHVWFVPVFVVTTAKATGELPFPGVRSALAAAPPFLLLAARGLTLISAGCLAALPSKAGRVIASGVVVAVAIATLVFPLRGATDSLYNQQQEYRFVDSFIEGLPGSALLLIPNEAALVTLDGEADSEGIFIADLFRTRALFDCVLGANPKNITVKTVGSEEELGQQHRGPVYFYAGLDCHRTGIKNKRPLCRAAVGFPGSTQIDKVDFSNRMYNSDFVDQLGIVSPTVGLTLYRLH